MTAPRVHSIRAAKRQRTETGLGQPPEHLTTEQRRAWRVFLRDPFMRDRLTPLHRPVVESYVILADQMHQAMRSGQSFRGFRRWLQLVAHLGCSPLARARILQAEGSAR